MKKKLLMLVTMLLPVMAMCALAVTEKASENSVIFDDTDHDFGTIKATGGTVAYEYKFTNKSKEPVIIITVTNGGCGCTTPTFPKEPIAPGKSGVVKVEFNPAGRRGEFNREVKVRLSSQKKRVSLKFSGVIVP